MSFAQEMKDFQDAFETGSRVRLNLANRQKVYESYRQPTKAELAEVGGQSFNGQGGRGVGQTSAPRQTAAGGGSSTYSGGDGRAGTKPGEIAEYVRASAARHGIDPDTAIKVANSEGGLTDPFRQGEAQLKYGREESYGPFQLHMRMGGVGERALAAGIDPRKDWKGGVDYAMAEAAKNGWGQWFGAKKVGVNDWDGIGGRKGSSPAATSGTVGIPEQTKDDAAWPDREEEEDEGYPEAASSGVQEDGVTAESPEITVVDAEQAAVRPVFVEDEFVTPQYARGGAIPDDTQLFEDGGTPINPSGTPDPYNPTRAYTQPVTQTAPAAQARRISIPAPVSGSGQMPPGQDWRTWGGQGGSPAQLQLRERQAGLAEQRAAAKAAADKAAADAAAKAAADAAAKKAAEDARLAQMNAWRQPWMQHPSNRTGSGSDRGGYTTSGRSGAGSFGSRSSSASRREGGLYEEGGAVDFKEGGPVKRRNFEYETPAGQPMMRRSRGSGDGVDYQMAGRKPKPKPKPAPALRSKPTSPPKAPARPRERNVPIPTPRPPRSEPETGPGGMPQVDALGNPIGANYPQGESFTQQEIDRQNRGPNGNPKLEKWKAERRRAAGDVPGPNLPTPNLRNRPKEGYNAGSRVIITVPGTDPEDLETSSGNAMGFARGGAIPDDDRPRSQRDAGYTTSGRGGSRSSAKKKPVAPETKSAKKQKPKSTTKKQNRNQKKRAPSQRLPDEGPIPGARPQSAAPASRFPDELPIPGGRPTPGGYTPGANRQEGEAASMAAMQRDRLGPGQTAEPYRPAPAPALRGPGRENLPTGGPPGLTPGPNRQADEARIMSQMQRDRLGPGQAPEPARPAPPAAPYQSPPPGPATRPGGYLDQAAGAVRGLRPSRAAIYGGGEPTPTEPIPERFGRGPPPDEPIQDPSLEPTPWLAYAKGGAIPDEEDSPYPNSRAEEAGYTTSSADPRVVAATAAREPDVAADRMAGGAPGITPTRQLAEAEAQPTQAEPPQPDVNPREARSNAAPAIQVGKNGIERIFGIGPRQQAAVPMPEEEAAREQGMRRFAKGEGAATRQEIQAIDHSFGFDQVKADEGTKNMMRLDATVQWHLQRGDKERAEAVAASLMLYGAGQVKQAGMMAEVAFNKYQQTGNPQDLRNASLAMQRAHQMIPDGLNMKIDIDPKTREIVATMIDDDGKMTKQVVDPMQIPALLQSAMDGSAYWDALEAIGQPEMALAGARNSRDAASKAEDRRYNEKLEQDRWERNQGAALEKEDRAAAAKLFERQLNAEEGQTAGERSEREMESFFVDWGEQLQQAATPEEKQKIVADGLGFRYENSPERDQPLSDADVALGVNSAISQGGVIDEADAPQILEIARMIGIKNPQLDEAGAGAAAVALVMQPNRINADGTVYANGADLVFNPMLLPNLSALRQKYKQ